ncbi:MAG: transcriptional regulator GcvA [Alphaproteobacteria bacterium]
MATTAVSLVAKSESEPRPSAPRRLPPLNTLRFFLATARHLSFAEAGAELFVTTAAVTAQIRKLEAHLGVPLFERTGRGLALTAAGQSILGGVSEAFDGISATLARLGQATDEGVLTLSVAPSFAAKWLTPRLESFIERHPDIDVRVLASEQVVDFGVDSVDAAIRYGPGRYHALIAEQVLSESVMPVCSPALLEKLGGNGPSQLFAQATLLHDESEERDRSCPDWRMWLKTAGIRDVDWRRGPRFNLSSLVIDAALAGRGIALAKTRLITDDLDAGRLVAISDESRPLEFAYYLVYPSDRRKLRKLRAFREWLLAESRRGQARAIAPIQRRQAE